MFPIHKLLLVADRSCPIPGVGGGHQGGRAQILSHQQAMRFSHKSMDSFCWEKLNRKPWVFSMK